MTQMHTSKPYEPSHPRSEEMERSQAPNPLTYPPTPERAWKSLLGSRFDRWFSFGLFATAALMLGFYLSVTYYSLFHSDAAMKLMLGQEMARQLTLVPSGWDYANDIPIIFPSLIAAPLLLFFSPSYPLHAAVDVTAAALLLYAAYAASRSVGIAGPLRWFIPTVFAAGLSRDFAEFVFGQSAYSAPLFILFAIAGCGARYLTATDGERRYRSFDLLVIAILIAAGVAGGPRGLATYAIPTIGALLGTYLLALRQRHAVSQRSRALLLSSSVATCIGGATFLLLLRHVNYTAGSIPRTLASGTQIVRNLQISAHNWLVLFDALPTSNAPLNGLTAVPYTFHFTFAVLVFVVPLRLLLRVWRIASQGLRFLILLHAALLISIGSVLVFSGILSHEPNGIPRYFLPLLPTAFLITVLWLQDLAHRTKLPMGRVGYLVELSFLAFSPMLLIAPAFADWSKPSLGLRPNPRDQIVASLESAGLKYGYATYWNANVITVLSREHVSAIPTLIDGGGLPKRQHFMTADRWFQQDQNDGKTFLLFDADDALKLNRPALQAVLGRPSQTLRVGRYEILVYPFNPSEKLGFSAPTQPDVVVPKTSATCLADYSALDDHLLSEPQAFGVLSVRATNRSTTTWTQNSTPYFDPGMRIVDSAGNQVSELRTTLPHAVRPGESIVIRMPFRSPAAGDYTLDFSFVIEGYAWCGDIGTKWAKASLTVKP